MNAEEIKLLQAQNEGYRKQNESLQKENAALKGTIDAYKMSENEANEIIAELKAYKDVNEDFKTAWEELKAENKKLKEENDGLKSQLDFEIQRRAVAENATNIDKRL